MADKSTIIDALRKWIAQRPGLEFGNYGDVSAYRAEMRSITRDLQHARAMVNYVAWHDSITADMILHAAGSGRLTLTADGEPDSVDASLWGIESEGDDYHEEIISELITECLSQITATIGE